MCMIWPLYGICWCSLDCNKYCISQLQTHIGSAQCERQWQQSGAVEACWAHNPEVRGSKPRSAKTIFSSNVSISGSIPAVQISVNLQPQNDDFWVSLVNYFQINWIIHFQTLLNFNDFDILYVACKMPLLTYYNIQGLGQKMNVIFILYNLILSWMTIFTIYKAIISWNNQLVGILA